VKRDPVILIVVAVVISLMLVFGIQKARHNNSSSLGGQSKLQGQLAPDFSLTALDGKTVKLSDFRGKAVLLNFWATWCEPCKIEMPWFVDLQKKYGPQGLQVLGVAMDDASPKEIAEFAQKMSVNYPVLVGKEAVGDQYGGIPYLPSTFYISRDGKVVERVFGLVSRSEIENNIQKALAQQGQVGGSAFGQTTGGFNGNGAAGRADLVSGAVVASISADTAGETGSGDSLGMTVPSAAGISPAAPQTTGGGGTGYGLSYAPTGVSYSSAAADPRPMFNVLVDPGGGTPSGINVKLSIATDGETFELEAVQQNVTVSGYTPGDVYLVADQWDTPLTDGADFDWSVSVTVHYSGGDQTVTYDPTSTHHRPSATAPVGVGWGLTGLSYLIPHGAYVTYVTGDGGVAGYTLGAGTTFTGPAYDFGVLTVDNHSSPTTYTYRSEHGNQEVFDATGKLLQRLDPQGEITTFNYTGDKLTGVTAPNGDRTTYTFQVLTTGGALLRNISVMAAADAGPRTASWDGTIGGVPAAAGTYRLRLAVYGPDGRISYLQKDIAIP
jgi:cytochrome c biogenesis protein CcmG/thiol:disulfide interchange protein DsbE